MSDDIKTFLKYTFLVHFIIAVFFGVTMTLFPIWLGDFLNWPYEELYFGRLAGAFFLGFATTSILRYHQPIDKWAKGLKINMRIGVRR